MMIEAEQPLPADEPSIPNHIAIIMDGNGRWATARNLPRIEGHRQGVASVRRTVEECARLGIGQLTLYCLSSENWKRPSHELDFLMHLLEQYMIEERSLLMEQGIRVQMIGRRDGIPERVLNEIDKTIELTASNIGTCLCLAINYGSRGEIVDAVKEIAAEITAGSIEAEEVDEQLIADHLLVRTNLPADLQEFLILKENAKFPKCPLISSQ